VKAPRRTKSFPNLSAISAAYALTSKSRNVFNRNTGDNEGSETSEEIVLGYSQHRHGTPETDDDDDGVTDGDDQGKSVSFPLLCTR
jgi:hypothetical protein